MEDKVFGDIEKSYMAQVLNSAAITGNVDEVEKAFSNIIEKGKKANVGEIREWSGKKFRKEPTGWKPVQMGKVTEVVKTDKEILDSIPILERQNVTGYKEWQKLVEAAKTNKAMDIPAVQAYRTYKENALKKFKNGSK